MAEPMRVTIVGAGLAGSTMAVLLSRLGYLVDIFEKRPNPGATDGVEGRSINLGVSARGIHALREIDLEPALLNSSVPMRGRLVHAGAGPPVFHPYGTAAHEVLHSVLRHELNTLLVRAAAAAPNVRFRFGARLSGLDRDDGRATFTDEVSGRQLIVDSDLVIGADGAFSTVRDHLVRAGGVDFSQTHLDWGYKELTIPAPPGGRAGADLEALHVWPGEHGLMVAHPNRDGSLTGTVFLPLEGRHSFATLDSPGTVRRFFDAHFPGARRIIPDLVQEFRANPVGRMVTIRTSRWHHRDRVVLLGDACHAVYPFYGQGMNAAFEDCTVLDACLRANPGDRAAALAAYQARRKPHTDVLADLAARNLVELRDRVRSPWFVARRRADLMLNRLFPRSWLPLYTMVSHTTTPYAEALARARRQDRLLGVAGASLAGLAAVGAGMSARRLRTRVG